MQVHESAGRGNRAFFWYAPRPALCLAAGFGRRFAESLALSLPSADAKKKAAKKQPAMEGDDTILVDSAWNGIAKSRS